MNIHDGLLGGALSRLGGLFSRRVPAPSAGHIHIHRPPTTGKSLTADNCIDCKQPTIFVGFHQEWYGWTETCIRCGRRFSDGEWMPFEFHREARRDSIKSALEQWGRSTDAERIHRVKGGDS